MGRVGLETYIFDILNSQLGAIVIPLLVAGAVELAKKQFDLTEVGGIGLNHLGDLVVDVLFIFIHMYIIAASDSFVKSER